MSIEERSRKHAKEISSAPYTQGDKIIVVHRRRRDIIISSTTIFQSSPSRCDGKSVCNLKLQLKLLWVGSIIIIPQNDNNEFIYACLTQLATKNKKTKYIQGSVNSIEEL